MLRKIHLLPNAFLFRIYTAINLIPLEFDSTTWQAVLCTSQLRKVHWKLNCFLLTLLTAFMNIRLIEILVYPERMNIIHFPLHFAIANFLTWTLYTVCIQFQADPGSTVQIYNEVNNHIQEEFRIASRPTGTVKKEFNLQEILLVSTPWLLLPSGMVVLTIYAVDPIRVQFFYSALPEEYQTTPILLACLYLEYALYNVSYASCTFCLCLHLAFFRDCLNQLRSLQDRPAGEVVKKLRKLQVIIKIFNEAHSSLVFAFKFFIILTAIIMNFMAVRYIETNHLLGMYGLYVAIHAEVTFLSQLDNAFSIPRQADLVKKSAMVDTFCRRQRRSRRLIRRQLMSFPFMGIKVGTFAYLERESTPNFLDYVTSKTASLLVTFR